MTAFTHAQQKQHYST